MPTTHAEITEEVLEIIEEHAVEVCKADELERDDWLKVRKPYIGGSEAAASIGLSPYESKYSLWVDKTTDAVSDEDNDYMKWGRRLEEAIGLGIAEDEEIPVTRFPYMMASKIWPWASVNVDFLSSADHRYPASVVEVKNVSGHMAREWEDGAVPPVYGLQGQHACAVLGLKGVHFFPLIGGHEGRPIYVERNDELIENLMDGERQFWDLVQSATPPAIDGSDSTNRALKSMFMDPEADSTIDLSDCATFDGLRVPDLLERRALAKAVIKEQTELVRELENQLYAWLGNAEIAYVDGVVAFTWKKVFTSGYSVAPKSYRRVNVPKK